MAVAVEVVAMPVPAVPVVVVTMPVVVMVVMTMMTVGTVVTMAVGTVVTMAVGTVVTATLVVAAALTATVMALAAAVTAVATRIGSRGDESCQADDERRSEGEECSTFEHSEGTFWVRDLLAHDEPSEPVVGTAGPQVQTIDFLSFFVHLTFIDGATVWQGGGSHRMANGLRTPVKSAESQALKQPAKNVDRRLLWVSSSH